jgi:hypothetical protein
MDGRQATIVAHCLNSDLAAARASLAESTPEQPWELQVASCLKVMCANPDNTSRREAVTAMITRFVERQPMPGYAFFRAQLGLTVTTLAGTVDSDAASRVFTQVVGEVIESEDGHAAREVLRYRDIPAAVTESSTQRSPACWPHPASGVEQCRNLSGGACWTRHGSRPVND